MRTRTAAIAALLLVTAAAPAGATTTTASTTADGLPAAAPTYGQTLPPIGFVGFCGRRPEACAARVTPHRRPHLDARQWETVARINRYVNAEVKPATDEAIYGEPEHWEYAGNRGDCEDYALLKQRFLEAIGLPRSALLLTVALDDRQDGHAVLTLATSEGDFILDNRRDAIRRWSDGDYTYLKRQSEADPRDWLSLAPEPPPQAATLAARSER